MFGFGFGFVNKQITPAEIEPPDPDSLAYLLFADGDTVGLEGDQDPDELAVFRPSNIKMVDLFLLDEPIQNGDVFGILSGNSRLLNILDIVDYLES
ncbi:hypothetical protein EVC24_020 [Rhizobium phage RHph_I4]|nr:hypothetical protein EVC24_020 [Rhizobium phage RHph_I4]